MNSFLIKLINNKIEVYEYKNEESIFVLIKYKGEKEQRYREDDFWKWWREKVEYDGRDVNFVVLTDRESFSTPKTISLSKKNIFNDVQDIDIILSNICKECNIIFLPDMDIIDKILKLISSF